MAASNATVSKILRFWPLLLAVILVLPAEAQDRSELEELERRIEEEQARGAELARKAEALEREFADLRRESVAAARRAQDIESRLIDSEALLAILAVEEGRKSLGLGAQRERLNAIVMALQRIALQPPESALAGSGHMLDRLRTAALLGSVASELETRAAALQRELDGLAALREEIDRKRAEVAEAATDLDAERQRLTELADRKQALFKSTQSERGNQERQAQALAAQAADLKDFIARLEADAARRRSEAERWQQAARLAAEARAEQERRASEQARVQSEPSDQASLVPREHQQAALPRDGAESGPAKAPSLRRPADVRAFPNAAPGLVPPIRGNVIVGFGEQNDAGFDTESKGLVITGRPGGQVVAPYDGQVVYVGRFRRYGLILIIEHDGRYHSLMAGMNRVDAVVGQWVLAGEPVGALGGQSGETRLYLELRQAGQPVDPDPWLMASDDKAKG